MNALPVLIRREFWEHRALWIAPLAVAALILLAALFGHVEVNLRDVLTEEQRRTVFAITQWALTIPQYLVMLVLLSFYLLDCLHAERKDRSILFWKSLPVSDAATVLSKLLVALVVVPLGVYCLTLVTDLLFAGIWALRFGSDAGPLLAWDTGIWLRVHGLMLLGLVIAILWYAPIAGYLLLVSA